MAIAFSRSMRSLELDSRSRGGLWVMAVAAIVLAAWTTWFLRARIAQYERTDHATIETIAGGRWRAVAWFPASALGRIRAGQPARVYFQTSALAAAVAVPPGSASPAILDIEASAKLQNDLPAIAEVQVENLTPAALLLRAAGRGQ